MSSASLNRVPQGRSRMECLELMKTDVAAMLHEKAAHYGDKEGFYETNGPGDYTHAVGEVKLKLGEFMRVGSNNGAFRRRLLVKAMTWIYLIYETEVANIGPIQD